MKYLISYFYHIRHFYPYMIPVSTALWDPKWYHNGMGQNHIFEDSRGVVNGLRCEKLHFPEELYDNLHDKQCKGKPCKYEPSTCEFLKEYEKYLFSLNFKLIIDELEYFAKEMKDTLEFSEDPIIVLMVHEANTNPCSERGPLIKLFKSNNIDIKEFEQTDFLKEKLILK